MDRAPCLHSANKTYPFLHKEKGWRQCIRSLFFLPLAHVHACDEGGLKNEDQRALC